MTSHASHEIVRTRGGALAMRSLADGEVMHPGVGPLVEAEQLYVRQSRLRERLFAKDGAELDRLVLFDVGLGAGSNALAARAASEELPAGAARLELVSFERDFGAIELALEAGEAFGCAANPPAPPAPSGRRGPRDRPDALAPRARRGPGGARRAAGARGHHLLGPLLAAREPRPLDGGGVRRRPAGREPPLRALHL